MLTTWFLTHCRAFMVGDFLRCTISVFRPFSWRENFRNAVMEQDLFTTVGLNSWQDFKNYILQFSENWAFRGQASANWILNNAIERTAFIDLYQDIEADFVAEFQRGARNYLNRDESPTHLIEWLALMQHHGAPTRLLDLTRSPFIAAYFAFEICSPLDQSPVAIWGMNISYLKKRSLEVLSDKYGDDLQRSKDRIDEALFEKIFYSNNNHLVFPVEPFSMNRRYSLQQSIFVSTGIGRIPLMQQLNFLGDDIKKTVVKMEIPASFRNEALRDLLQMNLHRASLFPDLDGYASSLRLRYESLKSPEEIKEELEQRLHDKDYPFYP